MEEEREPAEQAKKEQSVRKQENEPRGCALLDDTYRSVLKRKESSVLPNVMKGKSK